MKIQKKPLIISLLISVGTGVLSGIISMGSMDEYKSLDKPALSPPGIVFPIVWTVLFVLMGISAYLVYVSNGSATGKRRALSLYGFQLAVNFIWPILFFNAGEYLIAFFWLVLLWATVIIMTKSFYSINKRASYLQIPYILWLTFAGYLNYFVYLLNR